MKNNFRVWINHYFDILVYQFERFNIFLIENKEKEADFNDFCIYMYKNTKKYINPINNELTAPLH